MRIKAALYIIIIISSLISFEVSAKSYKFKIDSQTDVEMTRSSSPGKKMLRVIAYGRTSDKAIDQALVDAVVALSFKGVSNPETMENIPSILIDGKSQYITNNKFFNNFFKKGVFLKFVSRVNDTYPSGTNNVRTSRGQKVNILVIVDWKGLEEYYRENGFKTQLSAFGDNIL